jgi:hypothetical protein
MKKLNTLIVMVVAAAFANAGTIEQLVVTPAATAIVDVTTEYSSEKVWRGSDVGANEAAATVTTDLELPAEIGLQLSADYSAMDGTATTSNEATDLTAVFSKSVSDYLLSLSYTWYSEGFDQSGNDGAQEVGLSVSRKVGPVNLTLTQYLAVEGDNNGYSELLGAYSSNFNVLPVELDFTARVGYLVQDSVFTHAEARISTDLPVVEGIVAQPFVAYSTDLGGEFIDNFSGDNFFGGIQFKRSF